MNDDMHSDPLATEMIVTKKHETARRSWDKPANGPVAMIPVFEVHLSSSERRGRLRYSMAIDGLESADAEKFKVGERLAFRLGE